MKKRLYLIGAILWLAVTAHAQDISSSMEQKLEDVSESSETEIEDDSYLQNLDYYKRHPVNLNTATKEELQVFKFISDLQIDHLIQHRQLLGTLVDVYELQAIPGWDITTVQRIVPFVTIATVNLNALPLRDRFHKGEHSILLRETKLLQKARGYDKSLSNYYQGTNDHLFLRYKYQYRNQLQYGIVADKAAGEPFFKGVNKNGFDFYSAHIYARNIGTIKTVAIGDFTVNMGQGLIQWQTLAFRKSADVMAIKRQASELLPYNSAGEFFFHRGAGITIKKGNIELTGFASYKPTTASTKSDTMTKEKVATSFNPISYHRTASEIANKNSLQQTAFGGSIHFKKETISIGVNGIYYQFSLPLQKREEPYNLYAVKGKQWSNTSIDYSYTYHNLHFFGEAALDRKVHKAFVNGVLISAARNVDISLLYRNINKAYQSLYSNSFTENTTPCNENGWYMGMSFRPVAVWRIDTYADFYTFPWLKYRVDAPSNGRDYLVQVTYRPGKKLEIYMRYKSENKPYNTTDSFTTYPFYQPRQNIRTHVSYAVNRQFALRSRLETVSWKTNARTEKGLLSFIEGIYKLTPSLTAMLRLQYFNTRSYNTRIYAYEQDVLYSYSIPFFYSKGWRYYLNVNYDLTKKLSLWVRWAQNSYANKKVIGSGLDAIQGHCKTELKLQMRYTF